MVISQEDIDSKFRGTYERWTEVRIAKIMSIFGGREYFEGKTILELGCGYGHLGKHFVEHLGAKVTFAEGRKEFLPYIQANNPNSSVIHLDQDTDWNLGKKFDMIIHFGVLYHLDNWQRDLRNAMNHSNIVVLESEVLDTHMLIEAKFNDHSYYDQALNTKATKASAAFIELEILKNSGKFVRYDDHDLTAGIHHYHWQVSGDDDREEGVHYKEEKSNFTGVRPTHGVGKDGYRRFWVITK